jgi:signal recognition particle subunit SRP54
VAAQAGVAFYRAQATDVMKAVQEICDYRKKEDFDVLILDTAGRLHVDEQMLDELVRVDKIIRSEGKLLVLDAMTGQESLHVARTFQDRIGFHAAILTKMDSDTRGGAAFAFRYMLKKPILFVGVGERVSDLERFYADRIATRMLGMGDIVSLVERANDKMKVQEQDRLAQAMAKGRFTLDDFATQIDMMSKLGSFGQVLKYLPGTAQLKISPEKLEEGEREMKRFRAIIGSMTKKERLVPTILDGSRKKRVAQGSGVSVAEVNVLLERFQESQQMMKQLGKMGRFFK